MKILLSRARALLATGGEIGRTERAQFHEVREVEKILYWYASTHDLLVHDYIFDTIHCSCSAWRYCGVVDAQKERQEGSSNSLERDNKLGIGILSCSDCRISWNDKYHGLADPFGSYYCNLVVWSIMFFMLSI